MSAQAVSEPVLIEVEWRVRGLCGDWWLIERRTTHERCGRHVVSTWKRLAQVFGEERALRVEAILKRDEL